MPPVSLKRLKYPETFEVDEAASRGGEIVMRRRITAWQRHANWIRKHQWPARVVIVLMELTALYVYFVFVILLGAGFRR